MWTPMRDFCFIHPHPHPPHNHKFDYIVFKDNKLKQSIFYFIYLSKLNNNKISIFSSIFVLNIGNMFYIFDKTFNMTQYEITKDRISFHQLLHFSYF